MLFIQKANVLLLIMGTTFHRLPGESFQEFVWLAMVCHFSGSGSCLQVVKPICFFVLLFLFFFFLCMFVSFPLTLVHCRCICHIITNSLSIIVLQNCCIYSCKHLTVSRVHHVGHILVGTGMNQCVQCLELHALVYDWTLTRWLLAKELYPVPLHGSEIDTQQEVVCWEWLFQVCATGVEQRCCSHKRVLTGEEFAL